MFICFREAAKATLNEPSSEFLQIIDYWALIYCKPIIGSERPFSHIAVFVVSHHPIPSSSKSGKYAQCSNQYPHF